MNYFNLSALIGGLSAIVMSLFVYFKDKKNQINKIFALLSMSSGLWGLGYFSAITFTDKSSALFYSRAMHAIATLIPPFYFHFVLIISNFNERMRKRSLSITYGLGFVLLFFIGTPWFIKDMKPKFIFPWYSEAGIIYNFFTIYFFILIVYSFIILWQKIKYSSGIIRMQIKYILFASIFGFLGGTTTFPLVYNIPILPVGIIFFSFYPLIIAYAIIKHRLMDIRVAVTRVGIFFILYAILIRYTFLCRVLKTSSLFCY
ncbi:MAG: hypothetical protein NC820_02500 [Candidatus Omnitrophica bacterium]|nr:hypothetical protein [Candidatus Omnitrophota bacterium]